MFFDNILFLSYYKYDDLFLEVRGRWRNVVVFFFIFDYKGILGLGLEVILFLGFMLFWVIRILDVLGFCG